MFLELRECKARSNSVAEGAKYLLTPTSYDVSVKSINCVCARTNKQFILIDTPNTENEIKWCECYPDLNHTLRQFFALCNRLSERSRCNLLRNSP